MAARQRLVVIGNGMAGARAVEEILARGGASQFEITMFGDEPTGNYNRILLSNVLNGSTGEDDIYLNPLSWYEENGIKLHAGQRVWRIWRQSRHVATEHGLAEAYDKLIIATGSRPFLPPVEGRHTSAGCLTPGVFVFRTLEDCRQIAAYAAGKKRAAVIGGGLLGLEAARGLQNFGLKVSVIHLAGHLMQQQLDAPPAPSCARAWNVWVSRSCSRRTRRRFLATAPSRACSSRTGRRSNATWSSSPPGSSPIPMSRSAPG